MYMKSLFSMISIRGKLLLGYGLAFILTIVGAGVITHYMVRGVIESRIEDELKVSTTAIYTMLEATADITIKNHLRGIAQRNRDIVDFYYQRFRRGELTEAEAKRNVRRILLSQQIGKTGYIYCVNSEGVAVVHKSPGVEGSNFLYRSFVQDQIKRKEGYLIYDWQNPGDPEPRPKALYMTYFEPWDWIISVSSYRSEFIDLINVEDFRKGILDLRFGRTGYSFILDVEGKIIVHPSYQGSIHDIGDEDLRSSARKIITQKTGRIVYDWRNPHENVTRKKIVFLNYIPDLEWIVASSGYLDEFNEPLLYIQNIIFVITAAATAVVLLMTLWISSTITSPLRRLMNHFSTGATGDFTVRMDVSSNDEIGMLARYFNTFMEKLHLYSSSLHDEVEEHKRSVEALRESEERFRLLAENSPDIIISLVHEGFVSYVNPVVETILGYAPRELIGQTFLSMARRQDAREYVRLFKKIRDRRETVLDYTGVLVHKDGSLRHFIFCGAPTTDSQGQVVGIEGVLKDITERRVLESQLQQVQKLEAVGALAGGVAHDFNNILTAIRGSLDLSLLSAGRNDPLLKNLRQIENAVTKATDLTRKLLFFSRRQPIDTVPVHLNKSVDSILKIVERLIGTNISITLDLASDLQPVMADTGNIEQVIMNLVINARDAMPEGGKIFIRTRNVTIDESYTKAHSYAKTGEFVCLSVSDTGTGMDGETVKHIFEPFFTTKDRGKGTGLGLAVVYGIVKQHKGWITVDSRPGDGTEFRVYFPRADGEAGREPDMERLPADILGKGEKILIVEDDPDILSFAAAALKNWGYSVFTAASATEACEVFHRRQGDLALVFIDVVLPDRNGLDLAEEFVQADPGIRVLMTSGYMDEKSLARIVRENSHRFLAKPYSLQSMLAAVRAILDDLGEA
ncbi:MAG TPA: cache domain-containing protein [Deltaproteobacteria bacterium]|nr:cache domain-containing protein [Deltaproteobacteria bacterium]